MLNIELLSEKTVSVIDDVTGRTYKGTALFTVRVDSDKETIHITSQDSPIETFSARYDEISFGGTTYSNVEACVIALEPINFKKPSSGGGGGITTVRTDGVTVKGDGVTTPLTSPRQGLIIDGPYATTGDIPTPYDRTLMYLVGTSSPYDIYLANGEDNLFHAGYSDADFNLYLKIADADAKYVALTGDQTVSGTKTFSSTIRTYDLAPSTGGRSVGSASAPYGDGYFQTLNIINSPTEDRDAANKKYVDDAISGVVTYQLPARFNYAGSNTFTLPKAPIDIAEVRIDNADGTFILVQPSNYTVSGTEVTITDPTQIADGSRVGIFYFA